jgi:hypothetical protein
LLIRVHTWTIIIYIYCWSEFILGYYDSPSMNSDQQYIYYNRPSMNSDQQYIYIMIAQVWTLINNIYIIIDQVWTLINMFLIIHSLTNDFVIQIINKISFTSPHLILIWFYNCNSDSKCIEFILATWSIIIYILLIRVHTWAITDQQYIYYNRPSMNSDQQYIYIMIAQVCTWAIIIYIYCWSEFILGLS